MAKFYLICGKNGGSNFYLDEGLMSKLISKFEEPTKDEVDIWYENNYK